MRVVGLPVGLCVVGLTVGLRVVGLTVGLRVAGFFVGLCVVGLDEGVLVGLILGSSVTLQTPSHFGTHTLQAQAASTSVCPHQIWTRPTNIKSV